MQEVEESLRLLITIDSPAMLEEIVRVVDFDTEIHCRHHLLRSLERNNDASISNLDISLAMEVLNMCENKYIESISGYIPTSPNGIYLVKCTKFEAMMSVLSMVTK